MDTMRLQGNPVSQLMLTTVMSQAAADALVGIVASTFESSEKSSGALTHICMPGSLITMSPLYGVPCFPSMSGC